MAGEKEIRNKIRSVQNMQKITSAMEKVAASKIRKAQAQMEASRPRQHQHWQLLEREGMSRRRQRVIIPPSAVGVSVAARDGQMSSSRRRARAISRFCSRSRIDARLSCNFFPLPSARPNLIRRSLR